LTFTIDPRDVSVITKDSRRVIEPGIFDISIGGKQPGYTGKADTPMSGILTGPFSVTGSPVDLEP
jgi:beta-glucosidase